MFTTGKKSDVNPKKFATHLRWRVQLPVHGGPRSVALQQTRLPTQTLPLQVNILIGVLLLCWEEVHNQCSLNIMSVVKLAWIDGVFDRRRMRLWGQNRGHWRVSEGLPMLSLEREESWKVSQRWFPAGSSELPPFKTVTVGTGPHRSQRAQLKLLDTTLPVSHCPGMLTVCCERWGEELSS